MAEDCTVATGGTGQSWINAAKDLNISRQALIKALIRQALHQKYLARTMRPTLRKKREEWGTVRR
jgi:hypothetical protein